jgi:hypothetical protein
MVANNEHPYRVVFVSVRLVTEQISPMFVFVENVRYSGVGSGAGLRVLNVEGAIQGRKRSWTASPVPMGKRHCPLRSGTGVVNTLGNRAIDFTSLGQYRSRGFRQIPKSSRLLPIAG